jgi:hypothetical protein
MWSASTIGVLYIQGILGRLVEGVNFIITIFAKTFTDSLKVENNVARSLLNFLNDTSKIYVTAMLTKNGKFLLVVNWYIYIFPNLTL